MIIPSTTELDASTKYQISQAVMFIDDQEEYTTTLFDKNIMDKEVFKKTFGFSVVYSDNPSSDQRDWVNLSLSNELIDISEFEFMIPSKMLYTSDQPIIIEGENANYQVEIEFEYNVHRITIISDGNILIDSDFEDYKSKLENKYLNSGNDNYELSVNELSVEFDTEQLKVLVIFDNIYLNTNDGQTNVDLQLSSILISEK
jgi:hypothetical protein